MASPSKRPSSTKVENVHHNRVLSPDIERGGKSKGLLGRENPARKAKSERNLFSTASTANRVPTASSGLKDLKNMTLAEHQEYIDQMMKSIRGPDIFEPKKEKLLKDETAAWADVQDLNLPSPSKDYGNPALKNKLLSFDDTALKEKKPPTKSNKIPKKAKSDTNLLSGVIGISLHRKENNTAMDVPSDAKLVADSLEARQSPTKRTATRIEIEKGEGPSSISEKERSSRSLERRRGRNRPKSQYTDAAENHSKDENATLVDQYTEQRSQQVKVVDDMNAPSKKYRSSKGRRRQDKNERSTRRAHSRDAPRSLSPQRRDQRLLSLSPKETTNSPQAYKGLDRYESGSKSKNTFRHSPSRDKEQKGLRKSDCRRSTSLESSSSPSPSRAPGEQHRDRYSKTNSRARDNRYSSRSPSNDRSDPPRASSRDLSRLKKSVRSMSSVSSSPSQSPYRERHREKRCRRSRSRSRDHYEEENRPRIESSISPSKLGMRSSFREVRRHSRSQTQRSRSRDSSSSRSNSGGKDEDTQRKAESNRSRSRSRDASRSNTSRRYKQGRQYEDYSMITSSSGHSKSRSSRRLSSSGQKRSESGSHRGHSRNGRRDDGRIDGERRGKKDKVLEQEGANEANESSLSSLALRGSRHGRRDECTSGRSSERQTIFRSKKSGLLSRPRERSGSPTSDRSREEDITNKGSPRMRYRSKSTPRRKRDRFIQEKRGSDSRVRSYSTLISRRSKDNDNEVFEGSQEIFHRSHSSSGRRRGSRRDRDWVDTSRGMGSSSHHSVDSALRKSRTRRSDTLRKSTKYEVNGWKEILQRSLSGSGTNMSNVDDTKGLEAQNQSFSSRKDESRRGKNSNRARSGENRRSYRRAATPPVNVDTDNNEKKGSLPHCESPERPQKTSSRSRNRNSSRIIVKMEDYKDNDEPFIVLQSNSDSAIERKDGKDKEEFAASQSSLSQEDNDCLGDSFILLRDSHLSLKEQKEPRMTEGEAISILQRISRLYVARQKWRRLVEAARMKASLSNKRNIRGFRFNLEMRMEKDKEFASAATMAAHTIQNMIRSYQGRAKLFRLLEGVQRRRLISIIVIQKTVRVFLAKTERYRLKRKWQLEWERSYKLYEPLKADYLHYVQEERKRRTERVDLPDRLSKIEESLRSLEESHEEERQNLAKSMEVEKRVWCQVIQKKVDDEFARVGDDKQGLKISEEEKAELEHHQLELEEENAAMVDWLEKTRVKMEVKEAEKLELEKANADVEKMFNELNEFAKKKTAEKKELSGQQLMLSKMLFPKAGKQANSASEEAKKEMKSKLMHRRAMYKILEGLQKSNAYDHELYGEVKKMIEDCEDELNEKVLQGEECHDLVQNGVETYLGADMERFHALGEIPASPVKDSWGTAASGVLLSPSAKNSLSVGDLDKAWS